MSLRTFLVIALALAAPVRALAAGDCGWNEDKSFWSCGGSSGAVSGNSSPGVGDAVEGNPAALPAHPMPLGLEGTFSNRGSATNKAKVSVSTVKGFDGIGFGIGSWSERTFGAPDFDTHFQSSSYLKEFSDYQRDPPSTLGLRLGSSVRFPRALLPKGLYISAGGSLGLGRVSGHWSPQVGLLARLGVVGMGYSKSYEKIYATLPQIAISVLGAGMQLGVLYLGYSHIELSSAAGSSRANLYGLRFDLQQWTLYGNIKAQQDHRGAPDNWVRAGLQRRFRRLGLGYDYGLYRHSHSAVLQFYL